MEEMVPGLPPGIGEPFFDSVESSLPHLLFSIPAVKGVDFVAGFRGAAMRGGEPNDPFVIEGGRVVTATNHAGGILGGDWDGKPGSFPAPVRPTAPDATPEPAPDLR